VSLAGTLQRSGTIDLARFMLEQRLIGRMLIKLIAQPDIQASLIVYQWIESKSSNDLTSF
jgi:hypothetical protein